MNNKKIFIQEDVSFEFLKSKSLPKNLPISTPLTFAFIGNDLVLTKKKSGMWDILGGKIGGDESWQEALKREAYEEAGVFVENIEVIGYFIAENKSKAINFPEKTILPVTISFVKEIDKKWTPLETLERNIFKKKEALSLFEKRDDSEQIKEIFHYALSKINELEVEYIFDKSNSLNKIPTTQVMVFCKNEKDDYCIVRDYDESHFSLPGGGCDLGEDDFECARRELLEEAQIIMKNPTFLGSVLINFKKGEKIISQLKHVRIYCESERIDEFIPRKDSFEIEERKFIPIYNLKEKIPLLNNPSGEELINILYKK
jgi:8-oxo-dGTP pyrophosphatase MutT (NUDIX family)